MSVSSNSSVSDAARHILSAEERSQRTQRPAATQPAFVLPDLSPKHRESAQGRSDIAAALDQEQERLNRDGISDEKALHSDTRQLQASERQTRQVELGKAQPKQPATVEPAFAKPQEGAAKNISQSTDAEGAEGIVEAKDAQGTAKAEKLADEDAALVAQDPRQLLAQKPEFKAENSKNKPRTQGDETLGTSTAMVTEPMLQAPVQPSPASRVIADNAARAQVSQTSGNAVLGQAQLTPESREQGAANEQNTSRDRQEPSQQQELRAVPVEQANTSQPTQGADRAAFAVQGSAETQGSSNTAQAELVSNIMRQIDRMREQGRTSLQVTIPMPDGQDIKMILRMSESRVQVKIDAPTQDIHDEIQRGWADLTDRAGKSGVQLSSPLFFEDLPEDDQDRAQLA